MTLRLNKKTFNDAVRKILVAPKWNTEDINNVIYTLSLNNNKDLDVVDHILPLVQKALEANLHICAKKESIMQSRIGKFITDMKEGKIHTDPSVLTSWLQKWFGVEINDQNLNEKDSTYIDRILSQLKA